MAVRSDHVVASSLTLVANVATTLATCPSTERWIVKYIAIWNNTGLPADLQLQALFGGVSFPLRKQLAIPNQDILSLADQFIVVRSEESLQVRSSAAGNVRTYLAGARLAV